MGHNCCGSTNVHANTGRSYIERNTLMYCIEQYIGWGCIKLRWLPIKHVGGRLRLLWQVAQSFSITENLLQQFKVITMQIL